MMASLRIYFFNHCLWKVHSPGRTMEKLIDALAEKLPADAGRPTVELAFRAAIDALPKTKLREALLLKQKRLIGRLVALVRQKVPQELEGTGEEAAEQSRKVENQADDLALYQGVDTEKPGECLKHCESLLQNALVSLDPSVRAEEALGALVALFPETGALDVSGWVLVSVCFGFILNFQCFQYVALLLWG